MSTIQYNGQSWRRESDRRPPSWSMNLNLMATKQIVTSHVPPNFLQQMKLKELVKDNKDVIKVSSKASVDKALELLSKNRILSIPIFDEESQSFLGMATMWDLMVFITFTSTLRKNLSMPIIKILGISLESQSFWCFNGNQMLDHILQLFIRGIHRVLVIAEDDGNNSHLRVLSQSDIVKYLITYKNQLALGQLFAKSIGDLDLVKHSKVQAMSSLETALSCFKKMSLLGINATGIVNEAGEIITNLSVSDLRGLRQDLLRTITLPVLEFLKGQHGGKIITTVCATTTETFGKVIDLIVQHRLHRVWIVENQKPIGVVTLTDVISKCFEQR